MNQSFEFSKAERFVDRLAEVILHCGVGMKFVAALITGPPFRSLYKRIADPAILHIGVDVPAFDLTELSEFTGDAAGPDGDFQKTASTACGPFTDEDYVQILLEPIGDFEG